MAKGQTHLAGFQPVKPQSFSGSDLSTLPICTGRIVNVAASAMDVFRESLANTSTSQQNQQMISVKKPLASPCHAQWGFP